MRRRSRKWLLALILSLCAVDASAAIAFRIERDPTAQTDSKKTVRESSGWLLVVAEDDLVERLEALSGGVDRPGGTPSLSVGDSLLVVIFYAHPGLRPDRTGEVRCDVKILEPDGAVSTDETGVACFKGPMAEGEDSLYLPGMILRFTAEPQEPRGQWDVRVTLRDIVRGTDMLLRASFTLK